MKQGLERPGPPEMVAAAPTESFRPWYPFQLRLWPAWLALVSSLMLTGLPWWHSQQDLEDRTQAEFETEVTQLRADFIARMTGYTQAMRAAAAFVAAHEKLSREEWRDFAATLRLEKDHPAIQALAFARVVGDSDLKLLAGELRNSGVSDFAVYPRGVRERYVVNVFVEPYTEANIRALGYDMRQDAARRATMQRARATGEPTITPRTTLKIDEGGNPVPAFIMYMPVKRKSGRDVYGYVLSPFRMPILGDQLFKRRNRSISLTIHDGIDAISGKLFYASHPQKSDFEEKYVHSETLTIGGRPWTLTYAGLPDLETRDVTKSSTRVLAGGVLISFLLFTIAWALTSHRDRAIGVARRMTGSLRESEARFRILVEQSPDAITVYDAELGRFVDCNRQAEKLYGCSREELLATGPDKFYPLDKFDAPAARENLQKLVERVLGGEQLTIERYIRNAQGKNLCCEIRLVGLPSAGSRLIRGSLVDITERKLAEEAVRRSHALLETAQKAAHLGHYIADLESKAWSSDPLFDEIIGVDAGFKRDAASWNNVVHPEDRNSVLDYFSRSVKERQHFSSQEYRIIRPKDGETRWIAAWGSFMYGEDGVPLKQAGVVQDITWRKQVEAEILETKVRLEATLNAIPDLLFEVGCDGVVHHHQSPRLEALAAPTELFQGKKFSDVLPGGASVICQAALEEAAEKGWSSGRRLMLNFDGRSRWFELSVATKAEPDGLERRFIVLARDITERKQIELDLEALNKRMGALIEAIPDAIFFKDGEGRLLITNTAAKRLFRLDEIPWLGKTEPELVLLHPEFRAMHEACQRDDEKAWAAGCLALFAERVADENGQFRDFEVRKQPIFDGNGGRMGLVVISRDVTERKRIEQELQDQKEHLEDLVRRRTIELETALEAATRADKTKDVFLANMSHELRTPLNAVIGMAGLARGIRGDPRQRDYLDKIVSSGKHLSRIINDLLDLSKIAAGHMEMESIPFSLRTLIERGRGLMAQRVEERQLELVATIDPEVPDVLISDPLRVEQIVLNLVSNAIKFTRRGRVEIRIGQGVRDGNRVRLDITVADTGIGMSEEDLGRLFKPFSQADASVARQFGGTGLGLAISRQLVELMGGDIAVASRQGEGSTFVVRIWFPLGAADDLPLPDPAVGEAVTVRYRNAHVLVVDDQPFNREIIEALLTAVGIAPRMAGDGREALEILDESGPEAFDLVLMDIQMPVMDGLTATRQIRGRSGFESLPVVAMTAHTMEHEKEISVAAGMNDHIGKPIDNASFYRTLAKWLHARQEVAPAAAEAVAESSQPGATGAFPVLRGVDVDAGLARFGGRADRYRHWLADFVATAGAIPETIRAEIAQGKADAAARTAHAFKGRVGMLGMDGLHGIVAELELALHQGIAVDASLSLLERSVREMQQEIADVLQGANGKSRPESAPGLERLVWSNTFSIGVAQLDEQHRRLVDMINKLADCNDEGQGRSGAVFHEILSSMADYAQQHFREEEEHLRQIGYPDLAAHIKEHTAFVEKMTELSIAATNGVQDIGAVHRFLHTWFLDHVLDSDRRYCISASALGRPPDPPG
ncbi:MAG: bacteriohemerythrin [Betaproteobacteria bacterium]|nr:bacteriohemerythrin [Betaproteobacteria bacterium]